MSTETIQTAGSALVEEMRRLRAFPGNCDLANDLIDRAIAVQLAAEAASFAGPESAWVCPKCGTRAHADQCAVCLDQTPLVKAVPCPACYSGHFRPCQVCGDSGVAWLSMSPNAARSATPNPEDNHGS